MVALDLQAALAASRAGAQFKKKVRQERK